MAKLIELADGTWVDTLIVRAIVKHSWGEGSPPRVVVWFDDDGPAPCVLLCGSDREAEDLRAYLGMRVNLEREDQATDSTLGPSMEPRP